MTASVLRAFTFVAIAAAALIAAEPALAQNRPNIRPTFRPNKVRVMPVRPRLQQVRPPLQNLAGIKPSQAAAFAQRQMPGAKVVGVKRLPNGNYAVTLRTDSDVSRIIIDGQTGSAM
ncbi:MAG: hypothetical protein HC855_11065 [Rhizobiales bacterium]|nr:hypothetical protein [Hyphomicrobiales bacterium]